MSLFKLLLLGTGIYLSLIATSAAKVPKSLRSLNVAIQEVSPNANIAPQGDQKPAMSGSVDKRAVAQAEAAVNQQLQAIQRKIEAEEKSLERRLSELNRLRVQALEKSDEQRLKEIEGVEQEAIKDYERRVERILAATSSIKSSTAIAVPRRNVSVAPPRKPESNPAPTPPQQRRRRLWPFGR